MEPKTIVAIEIASSKIKGAVGRTDRDGNLSVLAVEELPASGIVRYGRVQNIREVTAAVNEILRRLEATPQLDGRHITGAAIALGGRSLTGVPAKASLKFHKECEITEKQVERLAFEAARDYVGDKNIEDTVPRVYYVNNSVFRQPVGTFGEALRGEFVMITCGRETRQNLERLKINGLDADNIEYVIRPTALADMLLTPDEKELGTALVDFGAETTTVAVYTGGALAFVCTIPMGSRLITLDLMAGLGITEEAAEHIKRNLGADGDEQALAYAHARAGEIAANVLNQLDLAGFGNTVITKIVLTGGGTKLGDFGAQLAAQSKITVREAEMPSEIGFRVAGRNNRDNVDIVALLLAAAKRFDTDCITSSEEPEEFSTGEVIAEVKADKIDDEYEQADDEPQDTVVEEEDDDSLLTDDPDDEEDEKGHGYSFSLFGRKKKHAEKPVREAPEKKQEPEPEPEKPRKPAPKPKPVPVPEPEPEQEDEVEPEVEPEVTGVNTDPDHSVRTRKTLENIRNKFVRIFTPPEDYNDDSDYNEE